MRHDEIMKKEMTKYYKKKDKCQARIRKDGSRGSHEEGMKT